MPKMVTYEGIQYWWNAEKKRVEIVDISIKPVTFAECPKEVLIELLKISADGSVAVKDCPEEVVNDLIKLLIKRAGG